MNDNDTPVERSERVLARVLVDTALTMEALGPGLQAVLEAHNVAPAARNAVADYLKEEITRRETAEVALIHHAREAQGDARLNAALGDTMSHVLTRLELLSEEVERTTGPRHLMAVANLREFSRTASEGWFGPREPPKTRTVKPPVIDFDMDR